jgi:predicted Holliday junction resolvase-like endonuclease
MLKTLLIAFLVYILFKFIFELLIPAAKVAGQVKKQMNSMQEQMESFKAQQQQNRAQSTQPKEEKKPEAAGEYIDFEEVSSK